MLILCVFSSFRLCETVVPLEDPIITETTSTLQEWGILWKQLYVVSSSSTRGENNLRPILFLSASSSGVDWGGGGFLLPALQARVANIWRYSPNIPRQLL